MKIIEMTPEELIRYPVRTALEDRLPGSLLIIRTKIEALDAIVLNVFSPHNEIFWYFGVYRKMLHQLRRYEEIYRNDGVDFVNLLCKRGKLARKNNSLYSFFYPIVSGKGDMFFPRSDDLDSDYTWFFAQRHLSIIFPVNRADEMIAYFNSQLDAFGNLCFRAVDERIVVAGDGTIDSLAGYDLLCRHPLKMNYEQKNLTIKLLSNHDFVSTIDERLLLILGTGLGGGSINSNIFKDKNPDPLNLGICKRRFDLSSQICTPRAYENIVGLLSDLAPEDEYLIPLFEERLSKLKEKYPVMDMTI